MDDDLSIRLAGTPLLLRRGDVLQPLERRDAALIAVLAVEGTKDRSQVARLLWPDLEEQQARAHLRQRLFRLKTTASRPLVLGSSVLALDPGLQVDVQTFDTGIVGDPDCGIGDLLADIDYSDIDTVDAWVGQARRRWLSTKIDRIAGLASRLEERREYAAALRYAARLVREAPTLEHGHRRVMRLHYLRGDRSAALDAYARCAKDLERDLGVEPDAETQALCALIASARSRETAAAPRPVSLRRPPRMVGRDDAWQAFERCLSDGTPLWIRAEAGMGKTRFLEEIRQATSGAVLVDARAGDAPYPYACLGRLVDALVAGHGAPSNAAVASELSRIASHLGPSPIGVLEPARLAAAIATGLDDWRSRGLSMVCIDDLHHADAASVDALTALRAPSAKTGIGWVVAARPVVPVPEAVVLVDLAPLDAGSVGELLGSLLLPGLEPTTWAATLTQHTGGNPFFILETLLSLLDHAGRLPARLPSPLPRSLRVGASIDERLSRLGSAATALARVAAVSGTDFDVRLASAVLRQRAVELASPWRELEAAYLFRGDGFRHDIVFEHVLRSIPEGIARTLHGDIAAALETRAAPAARIAEHWLAAAEWKRAGDALAAAARDARSRARRVEEIAFWERCAESYVRAQRFDLAFTARCESADAIYASRSPVEVVEVTARLCAEAGSPLQRLDALLPHAVALLTNDRFAEVLTTTAEARDLATLLDRPWKRFDAARAEAQALARLGRPAEGATLLGAFEAEVIADGHLSRRLAYATDLSYVLAVGHRRVEAVERLNEAIALAERLNDRSELLVLVSNLMSISGVIGRADEAAGHARRVLEMLDEMAGVRNHAALIARLNAAAALYEVGSFAEASSCLEEAHATMATRPSETIAAVYDNHLAMVRLVLGQPGLAAQALSPLSGSAASDPRIVLRRAIVFARLARARNDSTADASEEFHRATRSLVDIGLRLQVELEASRFAAPVVAAATCRRVCKVATALELLACAMRARVLEVDALVRLEDFTVAAKKARSTWRRMSTCHPVDLYYPEACWILHVALDRSEFSADRVLAAEVLDRASVWIRSAAASHVPAAFARTFLCDNPINRAVLSRQGAAAKEALE